MRVLRAADECGGPAAEARWTMYSEIGAPARARTPLRVLSAGVLTLLGLSVVTTVPAPAERATASAVVAALATPQPGTFSGLGFDACTAPSTATMQAWIASPYRAVGIYFGGPNRGCTQPNLTPEWASTQVAAGWHLIPIYMGLQAPCTTSNKIHLIDPATAAAQGLASGDDAIAQAQALGLPKESVLILDMEAYSTTDTACRTAVLTYVSNFNTRLHEAGYAAGFYSSMASGVGDLVEEYNNISYLHPDFLDFARWDGVATTSDSAIPAAYWSPRRRMKQYEGGHNETWGGVTINIDNDILDFAPLPSGQFGDINGNGWSDLIARENSTGTLFLYPGTGTRLRPRTQLGTGWTGYSVLTRLGDFDRDGFEDLIARQNSNGDLWLYPRTATAWKPRVKLGAGFNSVREITAVGDFDRDGFTDLLAIQPSTGDLLLYRGRGTGLNAGVKINSGWNGMSELVGMGDFDRDGFTDLIARVTSSGVLRLYLGKGDGFKSRTDIGTSWNTMRDLVSVGDFDRDGFTDLLAIETSTGYLFRYPGRGTTLGTRVRISTGWSGMAPLT